jgi:hypothetical protein
VKRVEESKPGINRNQLIVIRVRLPSLDRDHDEARLHSTLPCYYSYCTPSSSCVVCLSGPRFVMVCTSDRSKQGPRMAARRLPPPTIRAFFHNIHAWRSGSHADIPLGLIEANHRAPSGKRPVVICHGRYAIAMPMPPRRLLRTAREVAAFLSKPRGHTP